MPGEAVDLDPFSGRCGDFVAFWCVALLPGEVAREEETIFWWVGLVFDAITPPPPILLIGHGLAGVIDQPAPFVGCPQLAVPKPFLVGVGGGKVTIRVPGRRRFPNDYNPAAW